MNWSSGFSAEYYASIVDPNTWRDINRFEITGGSITRNDSELRESADIECLNYTEVTEQWIRIWLNAKQGNRNITTKANSYRNRLFIYWINLNTIKKYKWTHS